MFSSEVGLAAGNQEEEHPKVIDAGLFLNHIFSVKDCKVIEFEHFCPQMKKKSMQKPSKKMDKMYKKMLEKQRLQKKREKYEKLHKKRKQQVP